MQGIAEEKPMIRNQTSYLSERSFTEAVRAIQATHPAAAAVHQEMCLLYTGRVLADLLRGSRA